MTGPATAKAPAEHPIYGLTKAELDEVARTAPAPT